MRNPQPRVNLHAVNSPRQCCRPGCRNHAVATLTYDYSQSIAVVGPLGSTDEPHSWDLCEYHASRMTAPRGWEMLRNVPSCGGAVGSAALDDDLTALADTVREQPRRPVPRPAAMRSLPSISTMRPTGQVSPPASGPTARPSGRRGHLRVLPDPVD